MSEIRTIFSGFDRPFLDSAVGLLAGLAVSARVPDLSGCLCVVPTAEAGRRLRAALAQRFSCGVIPPGTVLPLGMLGSGNSASESEVLAAWLRVLKSPAVSQASSLLRNWDQRTESDSVLLHIAEKLQQTRMDLAGAGLSLKNAAATLDALCRSEAGTLENYCRFAEFLLLENAFLKELSKPDPAQFLLERAAAFPGEEKRHIAVIACPDAPDIFYPALEKAAAAGLDVTILVDGADDGSFDALGRPLAEKWLHRTIQFPISRLRRFSNVREESQWAAQTLQSGFHPAVIGVLGDELPGALRDAMLVHGADVRFPGEIPLGASGFGSFFLALLEWMEPRATYAALANVIRHGLFLSYAAHQGADVEKLLSLLDKVKSDFIPATADQFMDRAGQGTLEARLILQLAEQLKEASHADSPLRALYEVFAAIGESSAAELPDRARAAAELDALGQAVVEAERAADGNGPLAGLLLRHALKKQTLHFEEDSEPSLSVAGFLELAFYGEPDLLICGFNEENFKRASDADAFLPENAKQALKMRSGEDRYAADAARFEAICRHRDPAGSLTFSCAVTSASGDALMPARLLFQCAETELPERVELLFQGKLDRRMPGVSPQETFFPFFIRPEEPEKSFSVTAFSAYLRCPFRFYMERVLDADECDDRSCEFDASRCGTIAHEILDRSLTRSCGMTTAGEIEEVAQEELKAAERRRFGSFSPGASLLQFEALSRNLHYFALVEERLRAENWRTVAQEFPLRRDWRSVFAAFYPDAPEENWRAGVELRGQIDRIDRNDSSGAVRVIDYKTYREPKTPDSTHLKNASRMPEMPFSAAWDKFIWTDLQLPLYLALLRVCAPELSGSGLPESAYFNLPLAASDTGLSPFKNLDSEERLASAVRCADLCLRRIYVGHVFWPPGKSAGGEDYWGEFFGVMDRENLILPQDWEVSR